MAVAHGVARAHRVAKIVAVLVGLCYLLALAVFRVTEPTSDWEVVTDRGAYFWSVRSIWLMMWITAGYLLYLGLSAMREGQFPPQQAPLVVASKHSVGVRAFLASALLVVAAIILLSVPVLWYQGLEHLAKDLAQSPESAVMPP